MQLPPIDLTDAPSGAVIATFGDQPDAWPALMQLAAALAPQGMQAVREGRLLDGLDAWAFGFEVAALNDDTDGLLALVRYLFDLERELVFSGLGAPLSDPPPRADADVVLARMHALAAGGLAIAGRVVASATAAGDDARRMAGVAAHYRLLLISAPDVGYGLGGGVAPPGRPDDVPAARRADLAALAELAGRQDAWSLLLECVYSELACASEGELLGVLGIVALDEGALGLALERRRTLRPRLQSSASWPLYRTCEWAAERLQRLRGRVVMVNPAHAHRLSYEIAWVSTALARDRTVLALALGQSEAALMTREEGRSRALVDWMARGHDAKTLQRRGFRGAQAEVPPAGLQDIRNAARLNDAPILAYFAHEGGLHVWLVLPDGRILSESADRVDDLLRALMAALPYGTTPDDLLRGAIDDFFLELDDATDLDVLLARLAQALIPAPLRAALQARGGGRLVVMPDGELDMLPFCCLRIDGRYLVERFEIAYWPCVAAWHLCTRSMPGRIDLPPRVLGNPDLATLRAEGLALADLPGAADEASDVARRLRVAPAIGPAATIASIAPANVLHLATHGVLDMVQPEHSWLALADGRVTVDILRNEPGGLRTGLAVLSACQTALGQRHPDSMIGLSSGFFIAGACAVLSSLWKVPDTATRALMAGFYDALLSSPTMHTSAALALAQRAALADAATAHPFRWAAFRLAGTDAHPCPRLAVPA